MTTIPAHADGAATDTAGSGVDNVLPNVMVVADCANKMAVEDFWRDGCELVWLDGWLDG